MPIYIDDIHFFSDRYGISGEDTSCYLRKEHTPKPTSITLTNSILPASCSSDIPAFFMLNDDISDWNGERFTDLFEKLSNHGYAVFHFQISNQTDEDMFASFEREKNRLLEQYSFIDKNQLYIGGFGHGVSFLLYVTGHTNAFKAAVSLNAFVNYTTAYGNYEGCHEDYRKSNAQDFKSWLYAMAEKCPLRYLDQNKTPYLILHAHKDYICSEEQSEELFSGIKDRIPEIPCRMIIFPEENHYILMPGHEKYQERIASEILAWFTQY